MSDNAKINTTVLAVIMLRIMEFANEKHKSYREEFRPLIYKFVRIEKFFPNSMPPIYELI